MPDPGPSTPKLCFGLKSGTASSKAAPKPAIRPSAAAFNDASDDEEDGQLQDASTSDNDRRKSKNRNIHLHGLAPAKSATPATRIEKKKQQEAEQLDASIFDYDGVYDSIKDAERKFKQAKLAEDASKKPKYVDGILESAEQRKRDRLRAEARTIQKQRLAEGDEFADKESFVTNAYKEQQAELAKAEEQQDKEEQQQRTASKGMGTFYRDMLNETSAARDAAIAASLAGNTSTSTAPSAEVEAKGRSDADLAKEAREKGLEVELNDDNQIVDKRSLLSKGLNVVSKRRRPTQDDTDAASQRADRESKRERDQRRQEEYEARMNRDAQRSRQSALIEEQMLELERKRALQEQEALRREKSKVDAKRNDSEAISQAKQRYLERKKQRLAASNGSS
ncbi:uncharacterized protein SPSC_01330 [Sporisorium scitamineum]|uniref:Nuclear speckle splicing regulatory protein 1 N-terminal domain-containing protein n=1 Tax=Sporisorium scitamineum TaxID=49012 RepID=A0A0F7RY24_9BASI|nr:hypothetical protein [Sporisorium scitamineum]CDU22700.1 uncharacterized protein SPSC_01330 [Sporisorium scitamineum]